MSIQDPYSCDAQAFNALAHPARLQILDLLRDGESCVCHIQAMLGQRQAFISQHLNILRQAGLVNKRKEGLRVYYQISDPLVFTLMDRMAEVMVSAGKQPNGAGQNLDLKQAPHACNCPQCTEKLEALAGEKQNV